jgi:hypothetical protein
MRFLSATVAVAVLAAVATSAQAAPGKTSTPPPPVPVPSVAPPTQAATPLTMEGKAGCGVALVAIEQVASQFPEMFGKVPEADRKMTMFMMQVMGRQGQVYLDEAFAEGAKRNMTPAQVYTAGIKDMMGNFPKDFGDKRAGEEFATKFMARCLMPSGMPPS